MTSDPYSTETPRPMPAKNIALSSLFDPIFHPKLRGIRTLINFLVGFAFGWCIWLFSKRITGQIEPWDNPLGFFVYYQGGLFIAGVAASLARPSRFWVGAAGAFVGQVAYMETFLGPGMFPAPFGIILSGGFLSPILGGGLVWCGAMLMISIWKYPERFF